MEKYKVIQGRNGHCFDYGDIVELIRYSNTSPYFASVTRDPEVRQWLSWDDVIPIGLNRLTRVI